MEQPIEASLLMALPLLIVVVAAAALYLLRHPGRATNLPPSPPCFPIIGHLHYLRKRQPLHITLATLCQNYGPVIFLRFGSRPVVVVSSLQAAEECFTKNDIVLANRPDLLMWKYFGYNRTTITASSYGDHWRNLRRISAIEIFSAHRLNLLSEIRTDEVERLLNKILCRVSSNDGFSKVELRGMLSELTFNIMMRMVAGKSYLEDDAVDDNKSREFRCLIKDITKLGGASNPGDFFPLLGWVDFWGIEKRMIELSKKTDDFFQGLIDERRRKKMDQQEINNNNTMIDHLLNLQESQPDYYSDQLIKGLILVMLLGGSDTSSVTLEWTMSNLVNNPHVLNKAKTEIDETIHDRLMNESDLPNLHYLQNIISESLRLKPAAPLLLPHYSSDHSSIGGYHVPRHTMVMVNAWAIHRDPNLWDDPTSFKPERFERVGSEKMLMTFGMGRRSCPGASLARRVVGIMVGSLIQCFDWERLSKEKVDMGEGGGGTMPKALPLQVLCRPRSNAHKLLLTLDI